MLKTETPSIYNSNVKEKASIKTPNLWFHEGLYKLDGESKNQERRKERTAHRSSQTTEHSFRSQKPQDSRLFLVLRQKPNEKTVALQSNSEEDNQSSTRNL